ncbi:MAG: hypothetical protein PWP23_478 [Candidatus Sumerlaeota bacterium]|nr:hypothetical protein [Candidatus Sumerlaeota bacterium]
MTHNPSWKFPYATIAEAVENLRWSPNGSPKWNGKKSGQFFINEPELVCVAYTSRNTTSEYADLVQGKAREKYFPSDCSETALYRNSNPTAAAETATIKVYSILVSFFALQGGVRNFWLEMSLEKRGTRLHYTEEQKARVIDLVRRTAEEAGPGLVLVVRVERPYS